MNVFYFHGFDSSCEQSTTNKALKQYLKNVGCVSIEYTRENVIETGRVTNISEYDVLIGNSFGAFFALYFGLKLKIPFLLVNPSITPSDTLQKYGFSSELYKKSEKELSKLIKEEMKENIVSKTIIISNNDEIVDNSIILSSGITEVAKVIRTEWTHRIPKDGIPFIVEELKALV